MRSLPPTRGTTSWRIIWRLTWSSTFVLLFALLTSAAHASEQWCWDPVPKADGYRVHWSKLRVGPPPDDYAWIVCGRYPAPFACDRNVIATTATCIDDPDAAPVIPIPGPDEIIYVVVVAYSATIPSAPEERISCP